MNLVRNTGIILLVLFSSLGSLWALADSYTGSTFTSSCRYEHPLDTYEGCAAWTYAGQSAEECARARAMLDCRKAFSADCVLEGVTFSEILSLEFIGYKACEATVTVHGYRLN